jgi:AraC family transcriptional regulator
VRTAILERERTGGPGAVAGRILSSEAGWQVSDVICSLGPGDRSFEEGHNSYCVAAVLSGVFSYRSTYGAVHLQPGSLLLGNSGQCYRCSHEHGMGDRCLAFHFTGNFLEEVAAGLPGRRPSLRFSAHRVPPIRPLQPLIAKMQSCLGPVARTPPEFREIVLDLAGSVLALLRDGDIKAVHQVSYADQRRINAAVRYIEENYDRSALSLDELAQVAKLGVYHFIRAFQTLVGITPHQYVLCTRLFAAARRLRATREQVIELAYRVGFNDLANFNRSFRQTFGLSPTAYRGRPAPV